MTHRDLIAAARRQGWRIRRGRHWRLFPPDRSLPAVTVSSTPSEWRSLANTLADLRRSGLKL